VDGPCDRPADGVSAELLARRLRELGAAVHVLYCGPARGGRSAATLRRIRESGAAVSIAEDHGVPDSYLLHDIRPSAGADRSERVRHALRRLHAEHRFGLIEFQTAAGLGFRAIQAKRAGLDLEDVHLAVRLEACGPWRRECDSRWPSGLEELEGDFEERYGFENADFRTCLLPRVLSCAHAAGWEGRPDAVVAPGEPAALANAYADLLRRASAEPAGAVRGDSEPLPLVTVAVPHYNLGDCLPDALASLAVQTYANLEVIIVDDGSTEPASLLALERMRRQYAQFRFISQKNSGIGAARNRGLWEACGEFFLPMDADNVARPDMVERFVRAMHRNPRLSAMTCYFLAFEDGAAPGCGPYVYAHRPMGGPHVLASLNNVYGDANAIFRTEDFRAVGGYECDRETSFEDWEAFVKLANAGRGVGVVPDYLFYYRHRAAGFSRTTSDYRNHRRVLRQFVRVQSLPPAERVVLWTALVGFYRQAERRERLLRYRLADRVYDMCARLPGATRGLKWLLKSARNGWGRLVSGRLLRANDPVPLG
jgi:glycosyltransferase involved in cell wall biosynthesis